MNRKINVGIIFGGRSAEHEVSAHSANNIYHALDKKKYNAILIGIDKKGVWHFGPHTQVLLENKFPELKQFVGSSKNLPSNINHQQDVSNTLPTQTELADIDVFFPILHGPYGEDGTIQGLLKLLGKPFVGSGVLGSAIGMDKDIMKRLLIQANLPVVKYNVVKKQELNSISYVKTAEELGKVFFVKPANLGSSVGVHKIKNEDGFTDAIADAFRYDTKILFEEFVEAREIECSVLGNDSPKVSIPGEIIPNYEFYSYESKYLDENGAKITIPAQLSSNKTREIQDLAIKAFKTLCSEGLARVDFFLVKGTEKVYINEINTMPGFTNISMYPKLWEESNLSYSDLINKLIDLAFDRHKIESLLKTAI